MLLLTNTSSAVKLVTGAAASVDVHCDYADNNAGAITPGISANQNIATAATTTIVSAPASGVVRNVRGISLCNKHASASTQVTVSHTDGTVEVRLITCTLLAGETLVLDANGDWEHSDSQGAVYSPTSATVDPYSVYGQSGTIAESIPRMLCGEANLAAIASGTLFLQAIYLRAGQKINNISFFSATTAAGTPTQGFFALYDDSRNLLAQSANFTTEAWAANSIKTKALTAQYTVPTSGIYYIGIVIVATTVPTLKGLTAKTASQLAGVAPILHGSSSTGLTTTLPNPAAAITATVNAVWCAVS